VTTDATFNNRRMGWGRRLGIAIGLATMVSAGAGVAHAYTDTVVPCIERTTTKAFAPWGDNADYFLMAGGDFQQPSQWFKTDVGVMSSSTGLSTGVVTATAIGQGAFAPSQAPALNGATSSGTALKLVPLNGYSSGRGMPKTSYYTSMSVCTKVDEPTVRFFYRDPGIAGATLKVVVYQLVHSDSQNLSSRQVKNVSQVTITSTGTAGWKPSPVVKTNAAYSPTADIVVAFDATGGTCPAGATIFSDTCSWWQVDHLYVDPFRSR